MIKPFATIEISGRQMTRGPWDKFSFSLDGRYMIPKGSMDRWLLIEAKSDGSMIYGRFHDYDDRPDQVH